VSSGPAESDILVPNVVGQTEEDARKLLEKFSVTVTPVDSKEPKGTVLEQSIAPYSDSGEPTIVKINQQIIIKVSTGNPPETQVDITFLVPTGINKSASATFKTYINGNYKDQSSVDNVRYADTITVPVRGTGIQRVTIEAINNDVMKKTLIGEYEVDFDTGTSREIDFNEKAFRTVFEYTAETTTTAATTIYDPNPFPSNDDASPYNDDDIWNEVFNN
jgi:hypothetical protein